MEFLREKNEVLVRGQLGVGRNVSFVSCFFLLAVRNGHLGSSHNRC